MDIQYQLTEDRLTVMMPREVDHHAARHMSTEVDCLIDSWHIRTLVFDFAGTEFMDSSGIGVLIGRKKQWICTAAECRRYICRDGLCKSLKSRD